MFERPFCVGHQPHCDGCRPVCHKCATPSWPAKRCILLCGLAKEVVSRDVLANLQVGRAGRFGTKGLAITFVASETDSAVLNSVQV